METPLPDSLEKARDFLRAFLCLDNCVGPCRVILWDEGDEFFSLYRNRGGLFMTLSLLQKYPVLASETFYIDSSEYGIDTDEDIVTGLFFPLTFMIWSRLDTATLQSVCALYPEALYSTQGDYPDMLALACANQNVNASTVVWLLSVFTTDHLTELPLMPPFLSYFAAYMTAYKYDFVDLAEARHRGVAAIGIDGCVIQAFVQKNPDIAQYSSKEVFAIGYLLRQISYHDTDRLQLDIPPRLLVSHSATVFAILEQMHTPRPYLEAIIIDGWQHRNMTCLFDQYVACPHLREDVRDPSQAELEEANDSFLDWLLLNMSTNAALDITSFHPKKNVDLKIKRFHKLHPEKLNALLDKHAWSHYLKNTSNRFDLTPSVLLALHSRPDLICELTQRCSQGMGSHVSIFGYQRMRESSVQSTYYPCFKAFSMREGIEDAGTPLAVLVTATTKVLDAIITGLKAREKPPKTLKMNAFAMLNATLLANISQTFEVLQVKAVGFANGYDTPHEKRDGEWDSLCTGLSILPNFRHLAVAATFSKIGAGSHCRKLVELSIERVPSRVKNGTCFNVTDSLVELLTHQTRLRTLDIDGRSLRKGAKSFSFDMARVCSALKASVSLEKLRLFRLSKSPPLRLTEMLCDALKTSNTTLRSILFRDLEISSENKRPPKCRRRDISQNARIIQHYLWLNEFGRGHIRDKNISRGQFVQLLVALSEARQSFEASEKLVGPGLAGDDRTNTAGLLYAFLRELPELWCRSTKISRKQGS